MLGPIRFFCRILFLFNSFSRNSNTQSTHDRFFIFHGILGMMAALVANFPDKPVRFSAILGLFTPILITFFPWQILQKKSYLDFWEF